MIDTGNILSRIADQRITAREQRITNEADKGPQNSRNFEDIMKDSVTPAAGQRGRTHEVVDKKLMDVCTEMESLFVARMFKEMRKTVPKNEWLHGGFAEEVFEDMLYDEYALKLSRNTDLGLSKMLYNELSQKR